MELGCGPLFDADRKFSDKVTQMDISDYLAAFARRWVLIVGAVVLGTGCAAGATALITPEYSATARMFISAAGASSASDAYEGNLFSEKRITSYAEIATSRRVAEGVVRELGLGLSPDEVGAMITATPLRDSVILDITAVSTNAELSRDIANVAAGQTALAIKTLETSARGGEPTASASIMEAAVTPGSPSSPSWVRNILLGLLAGLVVGLAAAVVRDRTDAKVRSEADLAAAAGAGSLGSVRALAGVPDSEISGADSDFAATCNRLPGVGGAGITRLVVCGPTDGETGAVSATARGLAGAMTALGDPAVVVETGPGQRVAASGTVTGDRGRHDGRDRPGLFDVLAGQVTLADALVIESGAYVLPAGRAAGAGAGVLGSADMDAVLKELGLRFRYIVIAGAGVLDHPDVAVLRAVTDGAVLVGVPGTTTTTAAARAADRLRIAGLRVLGTVAAGSPARVLV